MRLDYFWNGKVYVPKNALNQVMAGDTFNTILMQYSAKFFLKIDPLWKRQVPKKKKTLL